MTVLMVSTVTMTSRNYFRLRAFPGFWQRRSHLSSSLKVLRIGFLCSSWHLFCKGIDSDFLPSRILENSRFWHIVWSIFVGPLSKFFHLSGEMPFWTMCAVGSHLTREDKLSGPRSPSKEELLFSVIWYNAPDMRGKVSEAETPCTLQNISFATVRKYHCTGLMLRPSEELPLINVTWEFSGFERQGLEIIWRGNDNRLLQTVNTLLS